MGPGSTPASGFEFLIVLFLSHDDEMTVQILSSYYVMHLIMFGNILLLQTILLLRKVGPRMLSVRFVTKVSVNTARRE